MVDQILSFIQTAVITIASAAFAAVGAVAVAYINSLRDRALKEVETRAEEAKQRKIREATNHLHDIVVTIVTSIEQEDKQKILQAIEDNHIDETELYNLRNIAVDRALAQLSVDDAVLLKEAYADLPAYTADLVSRKVYELKQMYK